MNCSYVESRLSSYLDGELTGREMLLVREHLCSCAECDRQAEQFKMMKQLLGALKTPEVRPGFEDHLVSFLLGEQAPKPSFLERIRTATRGNILSWGIGFAGIAAALFIYFTPEQQVIFVRNAGDPSHVGIMGPDPQTNPSLDRELWKYQQDHNNFRDQPIPVDLPTFKRVH